MGWVGLDRVGHVLCSSKDALSECKTRARELQACTAEEISVKIPYICIRSVLTQQPRHSQACTAEGNSTSLSALMYVAPARAAPPRPSLNLALPACTVCPTLAGGCCSPLHGYACFACSHAEHEFDFVQMQVTRLPAGDILPLRPTGRSTYVEP